MRILMVHSRYRQLGGEDLSTLAEMELLQQGGHTVDLLQYDNSRIEQMTAVATSVKTIWSSEAVGDVRRNLGKAKYDILHVQNYFPMVSPAVLIEASRAGVATVQALRNYRLACVNGILFRNGVDCQKCVGSWVPWQGVRLGCFRESRARSAVIAAMIGTHKVLGTWSRHTDAFIATSEAVRRIYVRAGFPEGRLFAKPNIVAEGVTQRERRTEVVFVGRLTPEKGVDQLIAAWHGNFPAAKLTIIGTGPDESTLRALALGDPTIDVLGELEHREVIASMARARLVAVPSIWEEPFGRIATEAYSVGTPVIATAKGGLVDIVGATGGGAIYEPGDISTLVSLIDRGLYDDAWWEKASSAASLAFATIYSAEAVLSRTEEIYNYAIARRRALAV